MHADAGPGSRGKAGTWPLHPGMSTGPRCCKNRPKTSDFPGASVQATSAVDGVPCDRSDANGLDSCPRFQPSPARLAPRDLSPVGRGDNQRSVVALLHRVYGRGGTCIPRCTAGRAPRASAQRLTLGQGSRPCR